MRNGHHKRTLVEDAAHPGDESSLPPALVKLRTPEYLRMVDEITNADETTIFGACMIGLIEGAIWDRCRTVPTRGMILEAAKCQSYEEAFALEDRLVALISSSAPGVGTVAGSLKRRTRAAPKPQLF